MKVWGYALAGNWRMVVEKLKLSRSYDNRFFDVEARLIVATFTQC